MTCTPIKTLITGLLLMLGLTACSAVEDDGYLAPPITAHFDLQSATRRAHASLATATYQLVTRDTDCRETCDVFERGFDQARRLQLVSPARCTEEYESQLWSQTEYQEGCRAYALKMISLLDQYKIAYRESGTS